jgi:hypothetical protein
VNRITTPERRAATRVDARLPLQLTEPDSRLVVTTESLDLSKSGVGCRTPDYLAPLSKVALTIILPPFGTLSRAPRSLRAEGVVVRCDPVPAGPDDEGADPEYELACCFTALSEDAQTVLDAFVAWRLLRTVRAEEERAAPHVRPPVRTAAHSRSGPRRPSPGAAPRGGGRGRPGTGPRYSDRTGPREAAHRGSAPHGRPRRDDPGRSRVDRPRPGAPPRSGAGRPAGPPGEDQPRSGARRGPRPDAERPRGGPRGERRGPERRGGERHGGERPPGPRPRRPGGHPARSGHEPGGVSRHARRPPEGGAPESAARDSGPGPAGEAPRQWGRRPARKPHGRPPEKGEGPANPRGRKD